MTCSTPPVGPPPTERDGRAQRPGRPAALVVLLALLAALVAGCGGSDPAVEQAPSQGSAAAVGAQRARAAEQTVLDQRARAVRERDLRLFLRRVDRSDRGLVARQTRYFRNLVQLPLAELGWRVEQEQWDIDAPASWGEDVRVPKITLSLQLAGYDARPVERVDGLAFDFRRGRPLIVSDRTGTGKPLTEGALAPWDLTAISVREERGVLGVFDARTKDTARTVVPVVREGIGQLDRALPFRWADRVVVYSIGDPQVLASFSDVPGGAIDHLGALTFPVYADPERHVASVRMLLLPSSVSAGQPFLGRIVRHELSHVAVGPRDDGAPTWFSEGLAEYLGARDLPEDQRIIPTDALARAREPQDGMPPSTGFNGDDQEWHYALSWMACDWIARTRGEATLWQLMRSLHAGGRGTTDAEQDMVLESVLGIGSVELSRQAAARIRTIYG
jgi:hypothetical protein